MLKKWLFAILFMLFLFGCQNDGAENNILDNNIENNDTNIEVMNENNNMSNEENAMVSVENNTNSQETDGKLTIHYIDVGQGDATLLQYEDDTAQYTILYDAGDWLGSEVVPYLEQANVTDIDMMIISHPHADHIGQLKPVMDNFQVGEVWMSGNSAGSEVFTKAMEAVSNSDASYEEPRTGDQYDVGPLVLTVLHPSKLTGELNEDSLSIHFQYKETAFVFTGDAYQAEEKEMISTGFPIEADVLQLGHHGSSTSSSEPFIDAVQPEIAIYSAGKDNSYGHPHKETVSLLKKKGIPMYGTDKDGTIIITSDGETIEVEPKEPGELLSQAPDNSDAEKSDSPEQNTQDSDGSDCININQASMTQLTKIVHIGEVRAQALIDARPFDSVDDLNRINGIGAKRLADIKAENKACVKGE